MNYPASPAKRRSPVVLAIAAVACALVLGGSVGYGIGDSESATNVEEASQTLPVPSPRYAPADSDAEKVYGFNDPADYSNILDRDESFLFEDPDGYSQFEFVRAIQTAQAVALDPEASLAELVRTRLDLGYVITEAVKPKADLQWDGLITETSGADDSTTAGSLRPTSVTVDLGRGQEMTFDSPPASDPDAFYAMEPGMPVTLVVEFTPDGTPGAEGPDGYKTTTPYVETEESMRDFLSMPAYQTRLTYFD